MDKQPEPSPAATDYDALFAKILDSDKIKIANLFLLSDMPEEQTLAFLNRWQSTPLDRRREVVHHLAEIAEDNFSVDFSFLFAPLLKDEDSELRLAALEGLWDSDDTALIDVLLEMAEGDSDDEVQANAASTLGHYVQLADHGQLPAHYTETIVNRLLAIFDKPGLEIRLQRSILETISQTTHERLPGMIEQAFQGRDRGLRITALYAMGSSADRRWLPHILGEFENDDEDIVLEAISAAGQIGASDAVQPLIELLQCDDDEIILEAVLALGRIGSEESEEALAAFIEEEDLADELLDAIEEALEELAWQSMTNLTILDIDPDILEPSGLDDDLGRQNGHSDD